MLKVTNITEKNQKTLIKQTKKFKKEGWTTFNACHLPMNCEDFPPKAYPKVPSFEPLIKSDVGSKIEENI